MPGLNCTKLTLLDHKSNLDNLKDLFGFFYCDIEAPKDSYLGLLPVRINFGINLPVGKWCGWYFSEELKFAQENGYKIKILKGYSFDKIPSVFKDYIYTIYKIKSNPINDAQKSMAKSLLNNLLGRFGINFDRPITDVLNTADYKVKSVMNKIVSYKQISNEKYLVSYIPKLDYDIIKSHNLDFLKVVNSYKDNEYQNIDNTSIVISAAVTAYARIHITKIKMYILHLGGEIFYSDTDSIVTNIKLPNNLVNENELGKLKLEHTIKKGIFITGKTYCLIDENDKFINKAKGIKSSSLKYEDYLKLLNNENVNTAIKTMSKTDWVKGDVKIFEKKEIIINSNSYTNRIKIIKNNKWIDTKPNIIDKSVNSLIKPNSSICKPNLKRLYHTYTNLKKQIYRNYFDKSLVIYKTPMLNITIFRLPILDLVIYSYISPTTSPSLIKSRFIFTKNLFIFVIIMIPLLLLALPFYEIDPIFSIETENENQIENNINNSEKEENKLVNKALDNETLSKSDKIYEETTTLLDQENWSTWEQDQTNQSNLDKNKLLDIIFREIVNEKIVNPNKFKSIDDIVKYGDDFLDKNHSDIENKQSVLDKLKDYEQDLIKIKAINNNSLERPSTATTVTTVNTCYDSRPNTAITVNTVQTDITRTDSRESTINNTLITPFTPFTPTTLHYLDHDIKNNQYKLNNLDSNDIDSEANKKDLLDEKRYLLDQKSKHLKSVLELAESTTLPGETYTIDKDKLQK